MNHRRVIPAIVLSVLSTLLLTPLPADPVGLDAIRFNIFDSAILDEQTFLLVGDHGKILLSRDGGTTWDEIASGTRKPLFSVSFPDRQNGWITGKSGLILHTGDGGRSWSVQPTPSDKHHFSIFFADARHGWAVGDWGAILATEDGGRTWGERSLGDDVVLYDVLFRDTANGWVCGEFGGLYRTSDGGSSWTKVEFTSPPDKAAGKPAKGEAPPREDPLSLFDKTLFAIARSGSRLIVAGMDGAILYSETGGEFWAQAVNPAPASLYGLELADKIGWAVGDVGTVLRSADGGEHWNLVDEVPAEKRLFWVQSISLLAADKGLIAGANGLLFFIRNGHLQEGAGGANQ